MGHKDISLLNVAAGLGRGLLVMGKLVKEASSFGWSCDRESGSTDLPILGRGGASRGEGASTLIIHTMLTLRNWRVGLPFCFLCDHYATCTNDIK